MLAALRTTEPLSGLMIFSIRLEEILRSYGLKRKEFEGTVIDVETDEQPFTDSERGAARYRKQSVTCCGLLDRERVQIVAKTRGASE